MGVSIRASCPFKEYPSAAQETRSPTREGLRQGGISRYNLRMAEFHEVLNSIRNWEGEEKPSPELYDDLANEFQKLTDQTEGAPNLIAERDNRINELSNEVTRLKSENYTLIVANGAVKNDDPPIEDTPKPRGITNLFSRKGA